MNKIPANIIEDINLLLGVQGVPYQRFIDGEWIATDCYHWRQPTLKDSYEHQFDPPKELTEALNRIARRVDLEMADVDKFDLDIYGARIQELFQEEDDEIRAMLDQIRPDLEEMSNASSRKKDQWRARLKTVRKLLSLKPYFPYGDIIVAPTKNQFDVLRIEETNGDNYDIGTEEIISSLSTIDQQYGIMILSAGFDHVSFEIERPPSGGEAVHLSGALLELCPGLIEVLSDSSEGIVELWWD